MGLGWVKGDPTLAILTRITLKSFFLMFFFLFFLLLGFTDIGLFFGFRVQGSIGLRSGRVIFPKHAGLTPPTLPA